MKEKVLFIAAMLGTFSATIILLINNILEIVGVEAGGYVDIINIVGTALALIILVVGVFFLNKYNVLQQKQTIAQNETINTALNGSSNLINSLLPKLAGDILDTAEKRGQVLLKDTQDKVDNMMNEMLPELAKQTMQLVTEQSQSIVEQTTAKANDTMQKMDELLPTYAKRISDQVAQTVRENNLHYHKMLTELKGLVNKLPKSSPVDNAKSNVDESIATLNQDINAKLEAMALAISLIKVPEPVILTSVTDAQPEEPIEDLPEYITDPIEDPMPVYENAVNPEDIAIEADLLVVEEAVELSPTELETTEEAINEEVIKLEESATQNEDISQKSDETKTE
jgi:hypothetical protein